MQLWIKYLRFMAFEPHAIHGLGQFRVENILELEESAMLRFSENTRKVLLAGLPGN